MTKKFFLNMKSIKFYNYFLGAKSEFIINAYLRLIPLFYNLQRKKGINENKDIKFWR